MNRSCIINILLFWLSYFEGIEADDMPLESLQWRFESKADKASYLKSMGAMFGQDHISNSDTQNNLTLNLCDLATYIEENGAKDGYERKMRNEI